MSRSRERMPRRAFVRRAAAFSLALVGAGFASLAAAAPCGSDNLLAARQPSATTGDVATDVSRVTDGAVGPEGAAWDAAAAVTWQNAAGSITYDLGAPQAISAIYLQADANDVYELFGSVDGSPASYKPIASFGSVVDARGHGLRARTADVSPPAAVRYVRIVAASGDGFYSVSELAAYCAKPNPFPPSLRIVDAPPAVATVKPGATAADRMWMLLLLAALFGLGQLAYRTVRPATPPAPGGPAGAREPVSEPKASTPPQ
jgi:hypothetical protein